MSPSNEFMQTAVHLSGDKKMIRFHFKMKTREVFSRLKLAKVSTATRTTSADACCPTSVGVYTARLLTRACQARKAHHYVLLNPIQIPYSSEDANKKQIVQADAPAK